MPEPGDRRPWPCAHHIEPADADADEIFFATHPYSHYGPHDHARGFCAVSEQGSVDERGQPDRGGLSPARGLSGLIAANVSFIVAVMVYMGWAYESALYGYFHLSPAELGFGVQDYLLASPRLFNPVIVIAAVALIAIVVAGTRGGSLVTAVRPTVGKAVDRLRTLPELQWLNDVILRRRIARLPAPRKIPNSVGERRRNPRVIAAVLGALLTVGALALAIIEQYVLVSTYLLLGLLAAGPLLLTRALRRNRAGIFPYTLAVVVSIVCILWAAALYASGLGSRAAQSLATHLSAQTAVAVYSVQPLALSGPGVTEQQLPPGYLYHYRYEGLRLLYLSSGTYYLLPAGWIPQLDLTYILNANDQTMFELYSAVQRTTYGD